jgi:phosphatidylserine/phosphatidylglycerophosphate/cardiolipin synthase-like enzyme
MTDPLYLDRLKEYLTKYYSSKKGLWNYSSNNTLADDWLLATPFNVFGVPYADFKQAVPGDYPLFKLSSQDAAGPTQQSVPIKATVTKLGDTPVNLLEGHSYKIYDEMYSVMIDAKIFLDITTLTLPTGRFETALTNALTYISNKPEDQRPIIRILYSNGVPNAADFPDLRLDASKFLKKILQNVDPAKKLTVYAGAINAGMEKGISAWITSWNHSKIVAADGQTAIVGGHNMWGEHYLDKNPVFDVSIKVRGESATHAQDYADKLWGYVLWRMNNDFLVHAQLQRGRLPLIHTAAYTYDAGSGTCTIKESYTPETITSVLSNITLALNPKGQPDKDVYTQAKTTFPAQSGAIPILSIGREAGMNLSYFFPDRNSYLSQQGEPADKSIYKLFSMAESKIRMSLQSFNILPLRFASIDWFVRGWDYTLFYEIAKAVRRGVIIEVVLSNPDAIAGGLKKTDAPYDGEDVKNVNERLRDVLINEFYLKAVEAETLVAQKFFVTNFRFSHDEMYPDNEGVKSVPLPNHAKTFMVDDRLFYIGSQNQYRCNLAEFGYVVEDATAARSYIDHYWTKLWEQSKRTLDFTYNGSLEKFQNAEATIFILDLLHNQRLDKTWQKGIKDYIDATTDAKAPNLGLLNDIISNAGYQTTADTVIELTKTPFFTNDRPSNQSNDESDRFVKNLFTDKDFLIDFAALVDSIDGDVADSDKAVNQFLKDKEYRCTVLQVYASLVGFRGSNLNYFRGEYAGIVVQDGGEAFDFRSQSECAKDKPHLKRSLLPEEPSFGQMQQGPVLLIESHQLVKLSGVVILKPTYTDNVLAWNQVDGNATSGSITFSEIFRPGLKDPFFGIECFGEIVYPDTGAAPLQGKISFYARIQGIKTPKTSDPDDPQRTPFDVLLHFPKLLVGVALLVCLCVIIKKRYSTNYFNRRNFDRQDSYRQIDSPSEPEDPDVIKFEGTDYKKLASEDKSKKNVNIELTPKLRKDLPSEDELKNSQTIEPTATFFKQLALNCKLENVEEIEKLEASIDSTSRRDNAAKQISKASADSGDGWARPLIRARNQIYVNYCVVENIKAVDMDRVQYTFKQQLSGLVDQSMIEDDYAKDSSQVVKDLLNSDFASQVRENVTSAFRDQIRQTVTNSMIDLRGADDYKRYAADEMGVYLDASIQTQLSDPMWERMEKPSTLGEQSYIESLLTEEVLTHKAEYLKVPENKSALQTDIDNELSSIVNSQQQTAAEKETASQGLEEAMSKLSRQPSTENQDRVAELTKRVDEMTKREEKLEEDRGKADVKKDELDTDKLEEKRKEVEKKAERKRGEVFRSVE